MLLVAQMSNLNGTQFSWRMNLHLQKINVHEFQIWVNSAKFFFNVNCMLSIHQVFHCLTSIINSFHLMLLFSCFVYSVETEKSTFMHMMSSLITKVIWWIKKELHLLNWYSHLDHHRILQLTIAMIDCFLLFSYLGLLNFPHHCMYMTLFSTIN